MSIKRFLPLKATLTLGVLGLLLLFTSLSPAPPAADPFADFAAARQAFLRLPNETAFDRLRGSWERLTWLGPLTLEGEIDPRLDNSRYWVVGGLAEQHDYPEAGYWQRLEALVGGEQLDDAKPVDTHLRAIGSYVGRLRQLQTRLKPQDRDTVAFLLATELYRQYELTLGGRHRLNRGRAEHDFLAFLDGLTYWLDYYRLDTGRATFLLSKARNAADPSLPTDHLELYKRWLRPLYLELTQDLPVEDLAHTLKVGGAAGGGLFDHEFLKPLRPNATPARVQLGRSLFFDPLLSGNFKRTCASCHKPKKAFSDGRTTSLGFDFSARLQRNAPSLVNILDGGGARGAGGEHPDVVHFIQSVFDHHQELRISMDTIVARIKSSEEYLVAFNVGYPHKGVDSTTVIDALVSYLYTLNDTDSDFDRAVDDSAKGIDPGVRRGYNLFRGKLGCGSCHFAPYFSGLLPPRFRRSEYHSLGLTGEEDLGWGKVRNHLRYNHFYRTPSLRNLAYTPPYGHNGKFISLEGFLEYLCDNDQTILRSTERPDFQLSADEERDLVTFLNALGGRIQESETENIYLPDLAIIPTDIRRRAGGIY